MATLGPIAGRIACGLLAAMHITPLWRVSRHVVEQGPTPALVATWAVLALLIGVLTAKAAGVVFFRVGSRRASITALIAAAALFHGDALAGKDIAPATVAVLVATATTVVAVSLGRKLHEHFAGVGEPFKSLFLNSSWSFAERPFFHDPLPVFDPGNAQPRGPPHRLALCRA
jgi:hypothetical protein